MPIAPRHLRPAIVMSACRTQSSEPLAKSMMSTVTFIDVVASDFEALADIRVAAMRDSLERVGRFDPNRARERLRSSFSPEHTRFIVFQGAKVGFFAVRPSPEGAQLDHLYIHPDYQGQGIGAAALSSIIADADKKNIPIFVGALKESASNRFYQRHGFTLRSEGEWDNYYVRAPSKSSNG